MPSKGEAHLDSWHVLQVKSAQEQIKQASVDVGLMFNSYVGLIVIVDNVLDCMSGSSDLKSGAGTVK